jgi:hypothetical protein
MHKFYFCSIVILNVLSVYWGNVFALNQSFQVNVIEAVNDGGLPIGCGNNSAVGGIEEMSLDLDNDGVADICIGGAVSAPNCLTPFNFDCSGTNAGSLCSTEQDSEIGEIMGGSLFLADKQGDEVGPNFRIFAESIDGLFVDNPLVIGFLDASSSPQTIGYFSLTINSNDCSYEFGRSFLFDDDEVVIYGDFIFLNTFDGA